MINSKQHGVHNSGPWEPWQASKSLVYQQGGGRVQNSGPWDPWLPVVENSQLFAQRAHSAGTMHGAPPTSPLSSGGPIVW